METYTRNDILESLNQHVAAQDKAKEDIATVGYLHFAKMVNHIKGHGTIKSSNALIMGPSGCGKTFIANKMADVLGVPFIDIDAKSLSKTGYVGTSIADVVFSAIKDIPHEQQPKIPYSVVFIDEFDKLVQGGSRQDWDLELQYSLLKLIEGTTMRNPDKHTMGPNSIETHNMLFIFGGNFASLREERAKREEKPKSIGFSEPEKPENKEISQQQEILEAGVVLELVGRISIITEVFDLTKEDLEYALLNTKSSILNQYTALCKNVFNTELDITDEEIDAIIDGCIKAKVGARGLHQELDKYMTKRLNDLKING